MLGRNGQRVTTTANDGAYTDNVGKGSATYSCVVCEAGTSTCSNEVTVVFQALLLKCRRRGSDDCRGEVPSAPQSRQLAIEGGGEALLVSGPERRRA